VLPYVEQLAPLLDAQVQLLHVIPECTQSTLFRAVGAPALAPSEDERALPQRAARLRDSGLRVIWDVRCGSAPTCILEAADGLPNAMLALSANGYGGAERKVFGRVVEAVARSARVPLLLIRTAEQRGSPWRPRRILVPLGDGACTQPALTHAARLARAGGAELLLLRVAPARARLEPAAGVAERANAAAPPELAAELAAAHAEASALAQRLGREGVAASPLAVWGDPAARIVTAAAELGADLVVMPTHGYGEMWRATGVGVADQVLHEIALPVLLVPAYGRG
jgi:nucleotide-binding universal stress UspA family protein